MITRLAVTCLAALSLASAASAERTVLSGGNVIDVRTGKVMSGTSILIENGRIVGMGSERSFGLDGSETTVDMKGAYILPGLSDSHVHLTSTATDNSYASLAISLPQSTISGVVNAEKTLRAGFTTVRNVGAGGYADVALRDAIMAGLIPGPRVIPAGVALGITGGHCDSNLLPFEYGEKAEGVADGPWAVRQKVRQNVKYGAEVIKFCGTGGVLSKGTKIGAQQYSAEEMAAIVDEAELLGVKVAVHAHGTQGITTAINAGVASVEHASLISDEGIRLAKENGTFLSMDVYVSDYILSEGEAAGILPESLAKERQVGRAQRESFKRAVDAGAKIAIGTDAGVYAHGLNGKQFAYMVEWGMTPLQAIQASTIGNAELFGMSADIGAIEVGKEADIIAVKSNPLDDVSVLESIDFVMADGKIFANDLGE